VQKWKVNFARGATTRACGGALVRGSRLASCKRGNPGVLGVTSYLFLD